MKKNTIKLIVAALMGAAATTMVVTHLPQPTSTTSVDMASPSGEPIHADVPMVEETTTTTTTPVVETTVTTTEDAPPPAPAPSTTTTSTTRPAPATTTTTTAPAPVVVQPSTTTTTAPHGKMTDPSSARPWAGSDCTTTPLPAGYTPNRQVRWAPGWEERNGQIIVWSKRVNTGNTPLAPATGVFEVTLIDQSKVEVEIEFPEESCPFGESKEQYQEIVFTSGTPQGIEQGPAVVFKSER